MKNNAMLFLILVLVLVFCVINISSLRSKIDTLELQNTKQHLEILQMISSNQEHISDNLDSIKGLQNNVNNIFDIIINLYSLQGD